MKKTLLFLFVLSCQFSFGQISAEYKALANNARQFYRQQKYKEAATTFSKAFAIKNIGYVKDRYTAACAWAHINKTDSAFVQLFKITKNADYKRYDFVVADTNLNNLHEDKRWEKILKILKKNKEEAEAKLDKPLIKKLKKIMYQDQHWRVLSDSVREEYGRGSDELNAIWDTIQKYDSIDLAQVKKILDTRGWLSSDVIGRQGNETLFLVIQHADLTTQKKYLPMMKKAVKNGNAYPSQYALLVDRVAIRQGQKQTYGSQIGIDSTGNFYVLPLKNPDHVNERRKKMNLGTLEDYVKHWDLIWDVKKYKKKLPVLTKRMKEVRGNN